MKCWRCRAPLRSTLIHRDSLIRGRALSKGGPYRLYRCPKCLRENKIESNSKGRLFASPPKEISILEYLFGWIEPLAPEDFLRILEWQEENSAKQSAFFVGAESRGMSHRFRQLLLSIFRRIGLWLNHIPPQTSDQLPLDNAATDAKNQPAGQEQRGHANSPKNERATRSGVPLPYQILGISIDASEEEIRAAFRRLARKWHPDKQRDPSDVTEATRRWRELMRAYESIKGHRS